MDVDLAKGTEFLHGVWGMCGFVFYFKFANVVQTGLGGSK